MKTITFFVPGKPVGKGRPRFTRSGHTYTPDSTRSYENHVRNCWCDQAAAAAVPLGHPLSVTIKAFFPVPKTASKRKRTSMIFQPHTKKPDLDNVIKAVLDALNGAAFPDDSAVSCIAAVKKYSLNPGVEVTLRYQDKDHEEDPLFP